MTIDEQFPGTMGSSMGALNALFEPRSVAVVGASSNPARIGGYALRLSRDRGFAGDLVAVNHSKEVPGFATSQSLRDLSDPPDLAVIALPAEAVESVVSDALDVGVSACIVFSGRPDCLSPDLLGRAKSQGMRILGPNCAGSMSTRSNLVASFGTLLDSQQYFGRGDVSVVSQSGAAAAYLMATSARRGDGFREWISTGNEVDIKAGECVEFLASHKAPSAIAVYLESLRDPAAFAAGALAARQRGIPVVVLKGGKSQWGQRAAMAHTAAVATDNVLLSQFFRELGVIECSSIEELSELPWQLARQYPRTAGPGLGVLTISGAAGVLIADAASGHDLPLAELSGASVQKVQERIPLASTSNPVDVSGNVGNDPDSLSDALEIMLADDNVGQLIVYLGHMALGAGRAEKFRDLLHSAWSRSEKAVWGVCLLDTVCDVAFPNSAGPTSATSLAKHYAIFARSTSIDVSRAVQTRLATQKWSFSGTPSIVGDVEARSLLDLLDVVQPQEVLIAPGDEDRIDDWTGGDPVVLKVSSRDTPHKRLVGGVRLGVPVQSMPREVDQLLSEVAQAAPHAAIDGVYVQEQIVGEVELLVGARNSQLLGPCVTFGRGGSDLESRADVVTLLAPASLDAVHEAIEVNPHWLNDMPREIQEQFARLIVQMSELAWRDRLRLVSMEINPLMATQGGSLVACDVLVEMGEVA